MTTHNWNGPAGRGAAKIRREVKREEAEARNAAAQAPWQCSEGHTHGNGMQCVRVFDHEGDPTPRFTGRRSEASRQV